MRAMRTPALALLSALAASAPPQELLPGGVREASAAYPCAPSPGVVRFFQLTTEAPDVARLAAELRALGAELGAEIVYGPRTSPSRPGKAFVAVRAASEVAAPALGAALERGGAAAEGLACFAFDGATPPERDDSSGAWRERVLALSEELAWYDAVGGWSQLYARPGKLRAHELVTRYATLGGARLGEVVKERFRWTLAAPPDEATRRRVLAALERMAGVEGAAIDGRELVVTLRLERLEACGSLGVFPSAGAALDEAARRAPRAAFDAGPLFELLRVERLVP
jgi:hypothetical protein